jgi:hypothetical protein
MLADLDSKPPFFLKSIRALLDALQGDSGSDWLNICGFGFGSSINVASVHQSGY